MTIHSNHPFHLVDISPWPLIGSLGTLELIIGLINWFNFFDISLFFLGLIVILLTIYQWWRDISREGAFQGIHTFKVVRGLKLGIILFIISEVFFFFSFFWGFFHRSLSPSFEIGICWPPVGLISFNPIQVPLLNTIILLSSGISVTWAHHRLMENNYDQVLQGLFITVFLGLYFSFLQYFEYIEASFTLADSVYGRTFFMATGFHGLHVLIGSTFLLVCLLRHFNYHFSNSHHFGFEASAWYWHFVDVVWLFLYLFVYWWGGN